jgi:transposase
VQVCALLTQLAAASTGLPLTVVLDNARYQRCKLVIAHAASLGLELLFLPPYLPNLNLIERLWKFVKKQCLYSSLLTLNFQTFEKAQSMPV